MQNYGFAKTIINKNNKKTKNEVMWNGDYNGNIANIEVNMNDNGNRELIKMQLDNNDILNMLGVQPINIPLEQRLQSDFLDAKATNTAEFALLKLKYIVSITPEADIQKIKVASSTTHKVDGLLQFIPRFQTIEKVGQY
jgi:hypothetical protein